MCEYRIKWIYKFIPEQFTVIGPPSFIWKGGEGKKMRQKNWGTLSRGFVLRSFRGPEILAWAEISEISNLWILESIQIWFISDNAFELNFKKPC